LALISNPEAGGDADPPVHPTDPQETGFLLPQLGVDKTSVSSLSKLLC